MRLGVMGGTFDPIHSGHLILAEQARERFDLEKVLFVTAAQPPHKLGEPMSSAADRLEMTRLAVADNPLFQCSTIEMDRPGPSYTVDTIRHLLGIYADGTVFYLLLGADEGRDLMTWREPYEIQKLAKIVVANRPGQSVAEALDSLPKDFARAIVPLEMPGVDISSTDLRDRVRSGRSIRYLVPRPVEDYIQQHRLYK